MPDMERLTDSMSIYLADTEEFKETMKGVVAKVGDDTLDESPMAYKDIFEVMRLQADLVEVVAHVTPLVNVKG